MEWYVWAGGLILLSQLLKKPSLRSGGLGERIENTLDFTINVLAEGDVVTIETLEAPAEIAVGGVPTVKVKANHNTATWEWIFARIRDRDTGVVVAPMISTYMLGVGSHTFQFVGGPYPYLGDWKEAMPDRNWNLVMEVGVVWV